MAGQAGAVHWFDFLSFFFLFFFLFSLSCVFALHGTVSFNILSVLLSPHL